MASSVRVRSGFVSAGGRRLHLLVCGAGPPLVLLPSPLILARTYRPLVRALGGAFTTFAVDLPGAGASGALEDADQRSERAALIAAILDRIGGAETLLVAHSCGGPIAVAAARLRPERLRGLVLVDSVGADPHERLGRLLVGRAVDTLLELRLAPAAAAHLLSNVARHGRSFLRDVRSAAAVRILEEAASVEVPTLVVHGRRDHTVRPSAAARLAARVPDAALAFAPGSHDHLILAPVAFANAVVFFAATLEARRRSRYGARRIAEPEGAPSLLFMHETDDEARAARQEGFAAALEAAALMGAGAAGLFAAQTNRRRRSPTPSSRAVAAEALRDVGLAAAFGGMLFGKVALDPAVRVLPDRDDRGRVVLSAWRRFAVPSGVGLAAGTIGWLTSPAREGRPALRRSGNLLLGGALLTGVVNVLCAELIARRAPRGEMPMETGRTGAARAAPADARLLRVGALTGFAHAALLAGLIGVAAALRIKTS